MKDGIHPKYSTTKIHCACGAEYHVGSTGNDIHIGVCSACHPFYTGQQKYLDTAGRVEKFRKRYGQQAAEKAKAETTSAS